MHHFSFTLLRTCVSALICLLFVQMARAQVPVFVENSAASGIDHYHLDPDLIGGGAALFDYDLDGHLDLFITGGEGRDRLFRNRGDASFEDVTRAAGIDGLWSTKTVGVLAADLNQDGMTDLLVTTGPGLANVLLLNDGNGRFRDRTAAAGMGQIAWSVSATAGDLDGDGDLDVYVGNYVDFSAEPFDQHITGPQGNFLYENLGNGRFRLLPDPAPAGCTLAALITDYDNDGDADILVGNDFGDFYTANQALRNDRGSFQDVGPAVGFQEAINCMGIAGGDYNGDGLLDYYITNLGVNYYYEGLPDGTLANKTGSRHAVDGFGTSWGTAQIDLNNDGLLDIVTAKGSLNANIGHDPNLLFLGETGRTTFSQNAIELPDGGFNKARGLVYGDLNGDGLLDVVTVGVRAADDGLARTQILLNTTDAAGHFLNVQLDDQVSIVGSRVAAFVDDQQWTVEVVRGGSYVSTSVTDVHFGLGTADHLDSLVVTWPDGERQLLPGPIAVDRKIAVNKNGVVTSVREQRPAASVVTAYPNPVVDRLYLKAAEKRNGTEPVSILSIQGGVAFDRVVTWTAGSADLIWPRGMPGGTFIVSGRGWSVRVVAGW